MNEIKRTKSKTKKTKHSPKNDPKTVDDRLCLTMIVKNESKIIERCLDSVKKHIDHWVIVDTGSTDGTQGIIKKHLKGIPGELHESKFINFGHNRTESVNLSKGKGAYLLLMDADLELKVANKNFKKEIFTEKADCYLITECDGISKDGNHKGFNYRNRIILKNNLDWVFEGSTHEVVDLQNSDTLRTKNYDGVWIHNRYDGGSKSEKFTRDIKLLLGDYEENPRNDRVMFYLGESHIHLAMKHVDEGDDYSSPKCTNLLRDAIHWYKKRSEVKESWPQEVYFSLFKMAKAKTLLDGEIDTLGYLKAYNYMPSRLEPIHNIVRHCREEKLYDIGYLLGKMAIKNKKSLSKDALFVDGNVYLYQMLDEFSICASWSGHNEEAIEAIETILPVIKGDVDKEVEERIIENLKICRNLIEKNV
jgi:glycosyltransferase involved in cell wall biosynthesis